MVGHESHDQTNIHSPWQFKDRSTELDYQNASICELVDRLRIPGAVYLAVAWITRLPVFWHLHFFETPPTKAEFYMTYIRLANIIIYSILYIAGQKSPQRIKRKIGYFLIWLMRLAIWPINLAHELGIEQCPTQVFMMQVPVILNRDLASVLLRVSPYSF